MRLTAEALEMLTQKRCTLWPDCNCYSFLSLWGRLLSDDEKLWDLADLEAGEDMIFITLRCVEGHCPDKAVRDYAKRQLRKPFWDRQRAKSPMDHYRWRMRMARKHERKMEAEGRVAVGRPGYARQTEEAMARLGGRSRKDLEPDHRRGAGSG